MSFFLKPWTSPLPSLVWVKVEVSCTRCTFFREQDLVQEGKGSHPGDRRFKKKKDYECKHRKKSLPSKVLVTCCSVCRALPLSQIISNFFKIKSLCDRNNRKGWLVSEIGTCGDVQNPCFKFFQVTSDTFLSIGNCH